MAKFSENLLEQIKERLSIVEVASRYLNLNRKGDRHWALCPFHTEKTPSFTVNEEKGFYHCFGCGKSGSIFDFVMEMEKLNFPEAVEKLANEAGLTIREESPQERKIRDEITALRDLYEKLSNSFHYILYNSDAAKGALAYLKERNFTKETALKFKLGYAPDDPKWLYDFLKSKQYSDKILEKSGLFARRDKTYPIFRNRLIFPIRDWQGRVVAFGGRDLGGSSNAKYINTPETIIYKKREIVYGLYESLDGLKKEDKAIISEGYFDVMALHQANVNYSMAPLGTSFTVEQAKLIRRYANKLYTLYDSDRAGYEATKKTLITAEQLGFENYVIELQGSKDPSDLLSSQGEKALFKLTEEGKTGFNHLVSRAILMYDSKKATGKLQIFEEVRPYLEAVDSEIVRQSYLRELANYLQLDEQTIIQDYLNRTKNRPTQQQREVKQSVSGAKQTRKPTKRSIDLYAMLTLINNRSLFPNVRNKLRIEDLLDEQAVELYTILEDSCRQGDVSSDQIILTKIGDENLRSLVAHSFQTEEYSRDPDKNLDELINKIILRKLENERKKIENLLRLAETEEAVFIELSHLLLEKKSLDEQIAKMRNESSD